MRSYLQFLFKRDINFKKYRVLTSKLKRKSPIGKYEYEIILSRLLAGKDGKVFQLNVVDTGAFNSWGGALEGILLESAPFFDNFKEYKWKEIKRPVVQYWVAKQKAAVDEQKKKKAKTIWTPAGDYTLWRISEYITDILLSKYAVLKDKAIIEDLNKKGNGFEADFNRQVLTPIKFYFDIEKIVSSAENAEKKAKKIIDCLISPQLYSSGSYEHLLEPEYSDGVPMPSLGDRKEEEVLWDIYEEEKKNIELLKISDVEKRIKMQEFFNSPQGKRLNALSAGKVHGGGLTFEEKEKRMKERMKEISRMIDKLLESWGLTDDDIEKGEKYYQYLYEKAAIERWKHQDSFDKSISETKKEMKEINEALRGNWDSNNLTLFGVILSIGLSVGFGLASVVEHYRVFVGFAGGISAEAISIYVIKKQFIRKRLLIWMVKILH